MIFSVIIAFVVTAGCILYPLASQAQTTRPLQVSVDTLRLNVCGSKTFTIGINVSQILRSDSVFGIQTVIYWDRSKFDLSSQVLVKSGTLSSQASEDKILKDPTSGAMVVQIGNTSANGIIAGSGPLFYLIGTVTATDTVEPPDGWITVQQIELTGTTTFQPTYSPGFVTVIRDTTAAYTGRISIAEAGFDTLRLDTLSIALANVRARRVREISFSIAGDTSAFEFVGSLEDETLAGSDLWSSKQIDVRSDSVQVRLVAHSDLGQEGILLKIVLRRTTDSAFTRTLNIHDFSVGAGTCLGRLTQEGEEVTASSIIRDSTPVAVRDDRQRRGDLIRVIPDRSGERITVNTRDLVVMRAEVVDLMGRQMAIAAIEANGSEGVVVRLQHPLTNGRYVIALQGVGMIVSKQFIIIK